MDSGSGSTTLKMAASMESTLEFPDDVDKLLKEYPDLEYQLNTKKIKCSLSGHEMPCKATAIRDYVKGKKFLKLQKDKEFNYERLQPHIIPNTKKNHEHQLFCLLTHSNINKTPRHVEGHINGKKYKRELERWKKCQETGEKFRPLCARKRKRETDIDSEGGKSFLDSDAESVASEDSLSDLYPPKHFGGADLNSDESYSFEDMPEGQPDGQTEGQTSTGGSGDNSSSKNKDRPKSKKKKNKSKKIKK